MIARVPTDDPSADELCCFIGTTAALLMLAAAAATTAGTVYAAHKASDTAEQAGNLQAKAAEDQLAFARTQAAQDQQNWERAMQFNLQQYNAKEARLAPFRNIGANANATLANLIGGANVAPVNYVPPPAQLPPMPGTPGVQTSAPTTRPTLASFMGPRPMGPMAARAPVTLNSFYRPQPAYA